MMTEDQIVSELRSMVRRSSQKQVAAKLGIHAQVLCDVLHRRRNVSETLAASLGYERRFMFFKRKADDLSAEGKQ